MFRRLKSESGQINWGGGYGVLFIVVCCVVAVLVYEVLVK